MALEAQEVAVRVRLLGGSQFKREAEGVAGATRDIGKAGKEVNASGGLGGFLNKTGTLLSSTGTKLMKHGQQVRQVGRTWSMLSIPIVAAGYYSVKAATQFGQAMSLLQRQANDSSKDVKYLAKQINGPLATALGTTPTDLAAGLYPIVSSNVHGKSAISALTAAAMGSKIGIDSLQNTANALMAVFNTKLKGSGNFMQIMAVIDQLVGQAKAKLPDLIEAMHSEIVPLAKDVGLRFADVGSAIASMTRMGVPAQKAANLMKLSLTKMFAPSGAGLKALNMMGIGQFQLANDLRKRDGLLTALMDLDKHLGRLPGGAHGNMANLLLAQAFGQSRGVANIASLLNSIPAMRQIQRVADAATPRTLKQHFNQAKQTAAFRFAQLHSQLQQSMITLGTAIIPVLIPLLKNLTTIVGSVVKWFKQLSPQTQHTILKIMALAVVLGPLVYVFGGLMSVTGGILSLFGTLSKWSGKLALTLFPRLASVIEGMAGSSVLGSLRLGFLGLLGPIGLAAIALAALGGGNPIKGVRKVVDKGADMLFGKGFSANNPVSQQDARYQFAFGSQFGSYGGYKQPPLGYKKWLYAHYNQYMNNQGYFHRVQPLLNKWWKTRVKPPGLMTGGMVLRSGMAMVGEAGPELLSLPRGAQVNPLPHISGASTVPTMGSGAGSLSGEWDFTVNVPVYLDGQVVANSTNRVNRRKANRR